jgi:GTP cyclohydrolase I
MAHELLSNVVGMGSDEHSRETPRRFIEQLQELTRHASCEDVFKCTKWKIFDAPSSDMIVVQNIAFVSLCSHHVLPFIGKVHIAYVPREAIAGLSKFSRVVTHFATQLQVQERMTMQIGDMLERALQPKGVGVIVRAEHLCMSIRGAQSIGTLTTTNTMRGVFGDHTRTAKAEFMAMVSGERL